MHADKEVVWVLDLNESMQNRLLKVVYMGEADHRGEDAILVQVCEFCVWNGEENWACASLGQRLHCTDGQASELLPRTMTDTVHGTMVRGVVMLGLLCMGQNERTRGTDEGDG